MIVHALRANGYPRNHDHERVRDQRDMNSVVEKMAALCDAGVDSALGRNRLSRGSKFVEAPVFLERARNPEQAAASLLEPVASLEAYSFLSAA
jgi:hypothetical protein